MLRHKEPGTHPPETTKVRFATFMFCELAVKVIESSWSGSVTPGYFRGHGERRTPIGSNRNHIGIGYQPREYTTSVRLPDRLRTLGVSRVSQHRHRSRTSGRFIHFTLPSSPSTVESCSGRHYALLWVKSSFLVGILSQLLSSGQCSAPHSAFHVPLKSAHSIPLPVAGGPF